MLSSDDTVSSRSEAGSVSCLAIARGRRNDGTADTRRNFFTDETARRREAFKEQDRSTQEWRAWGMTFVLDHHAAPRLEGDRGGE